jgi:hypothetical protein
LDSDLTITVQVAGGGGGVGGGATPMQPTEIRPNAIIKTKPKKTVINKCVLENKILI